jgi:16S rRNA (adenine1518-N6/adenine1519-N6)-dimethyltransferase
VAGAGFDPITALPPLRDVIAAHGLGANKALGQHFLLDLNLTSKIARAAGDLTAYPVIEIGPGPGGLTRALLLQGAQKVLAIEYDPRAVAALGSLVQAAQGRLTVIHADALTITIKDLLKDILKDSPKVKVVANLPYNIGTALLVKWLADFTLFDSLTLMFQREVAERLVAPCNTPAYGRLSVMTQWFMDVRILFHVPAAAFVPPPQVTSSVVQLIPRAAPFDEVDRTKLEKLLLTAFSQRRKMLRSALKSLFATNVEEILCTQGIEPTRRAETLSLAEFAKLARML